MREKGFTLIELLVVILVLLTLLVVAIPPIVTARTRAKVASVHQNMQVLESALEWFYLDYKRYPSEPSQTSLTNNRGSTGINLLHLEEYVEGIPEDPFRLDKSSIHGYPVYEYGSSYRPPAWILVSPGPDQVFDTTSIESFPMGTIAWEYDPTQGLKSDGDILCYGGDWGLGKWWLDGKKVGME